MKRLVAFILCLFALNAVAGNFDAYWNFADLIEAQAATNRVYITPIAPYGVNRTNVILGDRLTRTNDSAGRLTVSNLVNGRSYRIEVVGRFVTTTFTNSFDTNVNGYVTAGDPTYIAAPIRDRSTVAYSQLASDGRYLNTNDVAWAVRPGTNVVFLTNSDGSLTVSSSASGGTVQTNIPLASVTNGFNLYLVATNNGALLTNLAYIANNGGVGTNTTLRGNTVWTNGAVDVYRWMTWTNGILSLPAWNADVSGAGPQAPSISWRNTNGTESANIYVQGDHGGVDKPELILISTSRIGLGEGYDGLTGNGFIQLGRSTHTAGRVTIQYDDLTTTGWSDGLSGAGKTTLGHSKRLTFGARATNGVVSYPTLIGFAVSTNALFGNASSYDGVVAAGELWGYSAPPVYVPGTAFTNNTGVVVFKMHTNSFEVIGSNNVTGALYVGGGGIFTNFFSLTNSLFYFDASVKAVNKTFNVSDSSDLGRLAVGTTAVIVGDNGNNIEFDVRRNGSGYITRMGYDNGNYIMSSTSATVGQPALTLGAAQQATNATLEVIGTTMSTRGYQYFDIGTFPTSAIPVGSATLTNFAMIAYKGKPLTVATNRAVGGWMEWTNSAVSGANWYPFTP